MTRTPEVLVTRDDLAAMFRIIDGSAWDSLGRLFHPEMVYDRPGFDRLEGRDAVLRFYREVRAIRGEHRFEGMAVEGDAGAAWGRFVGHTPDRTPVDVEFADCYRFRDGMLWRRKSYFYVPVV